MSFQPTYCRDCDHVEPQSRKQHPRLWLCLQHPNIEGMGFVDPDTWVKEQPYLYCRNVNGGRCPLWKRRRDGQQELGVDDK